MWALAWSLRLDPGLSWNCEHVVHTTRHRGQCLVSLLQGTQLAPNIQTTEGGGPCSSGADGSNINNRQMNKLVSWPTCGLFLCHFGFTLHEWTASQRQHHYHQQQQQRNEHCAVRRWDASLTFGQMRVCSPKSHTTQRHTRMYAHTDTRTPTQRVSRITSEPILTKLLVHKDVRGAEELEEHIRPFSPRGISASVGRQNVFRLFVPLAGLFVFWLETKSLRHWGLGSSRDRVSSWFPRRSALKHDCSGHMIQKIDQENKAALKGTAGHFSKFPHCRKACGEMSRCVCFKYHCLLFWDPQMIDYFLVQCFFFFCFFGLMSFEGGGTVYCAPDLKTTSAEYYMMGKFAKLPS